MACCASTGEEAARNKNINRDLASDRKNMGRMVKLLLLGAGDSGKSTVAKQMKIIHLDGFTDEERASYKTAISNNVTRELGDDVLNLWQDPAIKATYERSNEYQLNDSTSYYFENITRIAQQDYLPTEQDVLRSRVKTTGVLETTFDVEDIIFRLVDVGGQRSERRKWVHCFEDVTAIIFCVAISEYDLKLYEDNETNRMHESLQLFKELCSTKWFQRTAFILFLNKKDIFEEKIKRVPLTVCFPEYVGKTSDVIEGGKEYIKERFLELNDNKQKTVYAHFTCATDTNNIMVVFNAVRDIILTKTLGQIGM